MSQELSDETLAKLPAKRRCGDCDMCCTAVGVDAMDKPPAVPCAKLCGAPGASCSIYADRPYECRAFLCLWRASDRLLPENMHPNRCGFVVAQGGRFGVWPPVITVHPGPDHPNSWKNPRWRPVFFELARKFNGIVVIGQGHLARHIFAPSGRDYSRAYFPQFFRDDGFVGLPETDFFPRRITLQEWTALTFGL